jgi:hypothetical protein
MSLVFKFSGIAGLLEGTLLSLLQLSLEISLTKLTTPLSRRYTQIAVLPLYL